MSEIAFWAGFSSIRRFNAAIRRAYGRSPTELRRVGNSAHAKANDLNLHNLQLKLSYRPLLDWPSLIQFLQARAILGKFSLPGILGVFVISVLRKTQTVNRQRLAAGISIQKHLRKPWLNLEPTLKVTCTTLICPWPRQVPPSNGY